MRENLQERRFASAVTADDAQNLAAPDVEIDVLERPELLGAVAGDHGAAAQHVARCAHKVARGPANHVAQGGSLTLTLVADNVFLTEPLRANNDLSGH